MSLTIRLLITFNFDLPLIEATCNRDESSHCISKRLHLNSVSNCSRLCRPYIYIQLFLRILRYTIL